MRAAQHPTILLFGGHSSVGLVWLCVSWFRDHWWFAVFVVAVVMYGCRRFYVRRSPAVRLAYRCSYGRFYGRRYPVRMNDSETRVMSFTQNIDRIIAVEVGKIGVVGQDELRVYLSGNPAGGNITLDFGRIHFVGMMYDRFCIRSVSVSVRPKVMPSAVGVSNYTFHLVWDRYYNDMFGSELTTNPRVVIDDPSAKMIVWFSGGNASVLTHRVYFTYRDRYQYSYIDHVFLSFGSPWWFISFGPSTIFVLIFRYVFDIGAVLALPLAVNLIFQYRFIIEFMGAVFMGIVFDAFVSGCSFGFMFFSPVDEEPEA